MFWHAQIFYFNFRKHSGLPITGILGGPLGLSTKFVRHSKDGLEEFDRLSRGIWVSVYISDISTFLQIKLPASFLRHGQPLTGYYHSLNVLHLNTLKLLAHQVPVLVSFFVSNLSNP